jgi:hypothetical protein
MTLHHRLNRSRLVFLLQQWKQGASAHAEQQDVAQRLSQWLGALEADRLNASLRAIESYPAQAGVGGGAGVPPGQPVDAVALEQTVQRAKAELTALVAATAVDDLDGTDPAADQALLNQRYQGVQKAFASRLKALRTLVRQQLAKGPPQLRRLAALDGVMEQMLATREPRLWASVPGHLAQRRSASAHLSHDLRALLQAELQVRLQPIVGLVEAARNEQPEQA